MTEKSSKELAFLRDLYIDADWTVKFTDLIDEKTVFEKDRRLLYINAGTGGHAIDLGSKVDAETAVVAVCEDEDVLNIASHKANAVNSKVTFTNRLGTEDRFEAVIADATLTKPGEVIDLVRTAANAAIEGGKIIVVAVSAGSFGEIFSLLWEALENEGLGDFGAAERLITDLPMVSDIEDAATKAGLTEVTSNTSVREFDYENGEAFVNSPLISNFFLPSWLDGIEPDLQEGVKTALAKLIDTESDGLTFRFSVKATILTGERV